MKSARVRRGPVAEGGSLLPALREGNPFRVDSIMFGLVCVKFEVLQRIFNSKFYILEPSLSTLNVR